MLPIVNKWFPAKKNEIKRGVTGSRDPLRHSWEVRTVYPEF